ncbi:MAG: 6-bladed beta-propeller [Longimicrobiales bacterium]
MIDSAGTRIAVTDARDVALPWTVERARHLGVEDAGPESFYRVSRATVAVHARGSLYVWDPFAHVLHAFDADFQPRWTAGREGAGPGEVRYSNSISVDELERIHVYDGAKQALVVFDKTGRVLPQIDFPSGPIRAREPHFAAVHDGFVYWHRDRFAGGDQRAVQLLWATSADTVVLHSSQPVLSRTAQFAGCPVRVGLPVLNAARLNWHAVGQRVAINVVPQYVIEVFDSRTRTQIVRRTISPVEMTEQEATAAYLERGRGGPMTCNADAREMMRQVGFEKATQVLADLAVTPQGEIWALRSARNQARGPIDVFDVNGRYLGTLPPGVPFPIAFLSETRFVAAETDELDVERIVVWDIKRESD